MDTEFAHPDTKHASSPTKSAPIALLRGDSAQQLLQKLHSFVSTYAYSLYEGSGGMHGKHMEHWTEAQGKFVSSNVEVRESGPWFHCNCTALNIAAEKIQVAIDAHQIVIHLDGNSSPDQLPQDGSVPLFYWAKWSLLVDPSTASAYLLEGIVTVEVKKTDPPAANPEVTPPNKSNP